MKARSPSSQRRVITDFEACSVALITAFTIGAAPFARAQGTAPTAPAEQGSPSESSSAAAFERADKNRDSRLSREEAMAMPAVAKSFEKIDANGDGSISRAEFGKAVK